MISIIIGDHDKGGKQTNTCHSIPIPPNQSLLRPTTKVFKILDCLTRMNLEIETMIIHESYNPSTTQHDIALLKVNTYKAVLFYQLND